jgi:hypothetical protein
MDKTHKLAGIRQTAIIFASLCCTAAALAVSTPVLAEPLQQDVPTAKDQRASSATTAG